MTEEELRIEKLRQKRYRKKLHRQEVLERKKRRSMALLDALRRRKKPQGSMKITKLETSPQKLSLFQKVLNIFYALWRRFHSQK